MDKRVLPLRRIPHLPFQELWQDIFEYKIPSYAVEKYDEPERLAKAMEMREKVTYIWSGGPCNENTTFDVSVKVPSESNFKTTSYELHFKIFPRFVLPCKHEIASRMTLERDLKKLLEKSVEEEKADKRVLEMLYERRYVEQEDPTLWYVRWFYPKEILEYSSFEKVNILL